VEGGGEMNNVHVDESKLWKYIRRNRIKVYKDMSADVLGERYIFIHGDMRQIIELSLFDMTQFAGKNILMVHLIEFISTILNRKQYEIIEEIEEEEE
jgi:hypothetical protein